MMLSMVAAICFAYMLVTTNSFSKSRMHPKKAAGSRRGSVNHSFVGREDSSVNIPYHIASLGITGNDYYLGNDQLCIPSSPTRVNEDRSSQQELSGMGHEEDPLIVIDPHLRS